MVDVPWRGGDEGGDEHGEAVAVLACQDGTIAVYDDEVVIERPSRSKFDHKTIPMAAVTDVGYSGGIAIGWLQVHERDREPATGGLLSSPVGENTLHFGRGTRDRARTVRDAILERAGG